MLLLLQTVVILLSFISLEHEALAEPLNTSIVLPVHKHTDASKPLYSVQVMIADSYPYYFTQQNLLIDLDAPVIWRTCYSLTNMPRCPADIDDCDPFSCEVYQCTQVQTFISNKYPYCQRETNTSTEPDLGFCTCPVNVANPIDASCVQAQLDFDAFEFDESNGGNIYNLRYLGANPYAACASPSSLESFPANVTGVMALSSSPYALPQSLSYPLIERVIGLCLPSTLFTLGVLIYGDSPFHLLPQSNVDVRSYLSYTPLINHPDSLGYFIGVNNIVIKKRSIAIPADATTKISTTEPYTILRTDIYNPVVRRFAKVTKRFPPAKPVPPFGLCFRTSTNGTQAALKVPDIDFGLPEGKKWTMSTANSIKEVTRDVACLAVVDGGATSAPAIVIGTFQMEDNFVVFNIKDSTFGFSSSLLRKKTSCSNFNYTRIDQSGMDAYP